MAATIHIAAALLLNEQGQTLLVRKRNTRAFMQPGGKVESGEQPAQALVRELEEELGIAVDPAEARFLGTYTAVAANEPGHEVHCELFQVRIKAQVSPAAEIEEALWVDATTVAKLELAPLTRDQILPLHFL